MCSLADSLIFPFITIKLVKSIFLIEVNCVVFRFNDLRIDRFSPSSPWREKDTDLLCGQTRTYRQTHRATPPRPLNPLPFLLVPREKSKKFAEQAAAVVFLRVRGVPEGRIGEEDSGLVCKRKREGQPDRGAGEEDSNKRRVFEAQRETRSGKSQGVSV